MKEPPCECVSDGEEKWQRKMLPNRGGVTERNCRVSGESELTGSVNLMAYYGLEHTYSKFSGKRLKESLSSFLPNLPGIVDTPGHNDQR